jgi:FkbM family methyltransferase
MSSDPDPSKRLIFHLLVRLWRGGMRFGSVIDVGCADGQYAVVLAENGPARDSVILNIDAQEDYRDSLAAIQQTLGGHYAICAIGDKDGGSIEITRGVHPYWSSPRAPGDPYWRSHHDLNAGAPRKVPQRTLDGLVGEVGAPGPYLIKLDVQGGELAALRGARRTLRATEAVMIEILMEDFAAIHAALDSRDFFLFDLSQFSYTPAGNIYCFYALYVSARHRHLVRAPLFEAEAKDEVIRSHEARREAIRGHLAESLERFRAGAWPDLKRTSGS